MSYTVTIKDNDTGKILRNETNVQVIMGSIIIRKDELRCRCENFVHSNNRKLCGNAWLAIQKLYEDLPKDFPWLIKAAIDSKKETFDTEEEMEQRIAADLANQKSTAGKALKPD